jgi:hypothetical protein
MAGLSTTQSFADGDTVTAAKLNNIIANASIDDDAVTTAKIADDAVTLAQMANNSVDTAELVDDAVSNAKLGTMLKRRVKANATDATANPTDVAIGANEVLVGTSNSLNAVSFADDLKLDNTDSSATKIVAAPGIITTKTTVSAASGDEFLIYDSDDTSNLHKTTAQSIVSSTAATSSVSGSTELATVGELISTSGAPANAVVGASVGSPMLAKAWCYFTTNVAAYNTAWGSVPGSAQTVVSAATFNIAAGIHTKDGTTSTGGVQQTAQGTFRVTFSTALPNTNYIATGNGHLTGLSNRHAGIKVTSKATTHFDFETTSSANTDTNNVAEFQLVVFGLGS